MRIEVRSIGFLVGWLVGVGLAPALAQTPYLVKDINTVPGGPYGGNPTDIVQVGSLAFFQGCDPCHGCEVWRSDGTGKGTFMLKDIRDASCGRATAHRRGRSSPRTSRRASLARTQAG